MPQVSQSNSSEIDDNLELRKEWSKEISLTVINRIKEARESLGKAQRALRDYIEKGGNISSLLDTFQAVKNEIPTTSTTN